MLLGDKRIKAAIARRLCAGCSESDFGVGSITVGCLLQTYEGDASHYYLFLDCVSKAEGFLRPVSCSMVFDYCCSKSDAS